MVEAKAAMVSKQYARYFADQFDDEEVLYVFRKHPIVMRKGIVLWAFGVLTGPVFELILIAFHKEVSIQGYFTALIAGFIFSLFLFAPSYIGWYFSVFIMTSQRFIQIKQKGLFHRGVSDVGLQQIQSVNYEVAGLQATLLGFGTIKMQTYVGDVEIHDLHHPAKIQKKLTGILREQGITGRQYPAQTGTDTEPLDEED